jgi:hypothetical protein
MKKIDLTECSLFFNISRNLHFDRGIQWLFTEDISKIKQLINHIKIIKRSSRTKKASQTHFKKLVYFGWHLFVGLKIYLCVNRNFKENPELMSFIKKDIFNLFDEAIDLALECMPYEALNVEHKNVQEYLLAMQINGKSLVFNSNFSKLHDLSCKFSKIAIDYSAEKHKFFSLAINNAALNFPQHDYVYNSNLFYFSIFGISEIHFKYNVYVNIVEIIEKVYRSCCWVNFKAVHLIEFEAKKCYHYTISIWMLIKNIPSNKRTVNQQRAYYFLIRKSLFKLKHRNNLKEQFATDFVKYLMQDIKNESWKLDSKDIKGILGTIELLGFKTSVKCDVNQILDIIFDKSFDQEMLSSPYQIKEENCSVRLYEHYFGWIAEEENLTIEQYHFLDCILERISNLNLSIYLEVIAILIALKRENESIVRRAVNIFVDMFAKSKGACNMSYIYILLYVAPRRLVAKSLLKKTYEKIVQIDGEYVAIKVIDDDNCSYKKFVIKSKYVNNAVISNNGYKHTVRFDLEQRMFVTSLGCANSKIEKLNQKNVVRYSFDKNLEQNDHFKKELFGLMHASIIKQTIFGEYRLLDNVSFLRKSGVSIDFAKYLNSII